MTDKEGGLLDAAKQAVRLERMEGEHKLLSTQMKGSLDNLASTLQSLQVESRTLVDRVSQLARLQDAHDTNKAAIADVKNTLSEMGLKLEDWFKAFDERQDRRWREYTEDRDRWRQRHEAENENDKRDLEREVRMVRETVIRAVGWGTGAGALFGVVVGGFLWNINYRFNEQTLDLTRTESNVQSNRTLVERNSGEINDLKLYLARGGRIPEEPYVPQSQRKGNDK